MSPRSPETGRIVSTEGAASFNMQAAVGLSLIAAAATVGAVEAQAIPVPPPQETAPTAGTPEPPFVELSVAAAPQKKGESTEVPTVEPTGEVTQVATQQSGVEPQSRDFVYFPRLDRTSSSSNITPTGTASHEATVVVTPSATSSATRTVPSPTFTASATATASPSATPSPSPEATPDPNILTLKPNDTVLIDHDQEALFQPADAFTQGDLTVHIDGTNQEAHHITASNKSTGWVSDKQEHIEPGLQRPIDAQWRRQTIIDSQTNKNGVVCSMADFSGCFYTNGSAIVLAGQPVNIGFRETVQNNTGGAAYFLIQRGTKAEPFAFGLKVDNTQDSKSSVSFVQGSDPSQFRPVHLEDVPVGSLLSYELRTNGDHNQVEIVKTAPDGSIIPHSGNRPIFELRHTLTSGQWWTYTSGERSTSRLTGLYFDYGPTAIDPDILPQENEIGSGLAVRTGKPIGVALELLMEGPNLDRIFGPVGEATYVNLIDGGFSASSFYDPALGRQPLTVDPEFADIVKDLAKYANLDIPVRLGVVPDWFTPADLDGQMGLLANLAPDQPVALEVWEQNGKLVMQSNMYQDRNNPNNNYSSPLVRLIDLARKANNMNSDEKWQKEKARAQLAGETDPSLGLRQVNIALRPATSLEEIPYDDLLALKDPRYGLRVDILYIDPTAWKLADVQRMISGSQPNDLKFQQLIAQFRIGFRMVADNVKLLDGSTKQVSPVEDLAQIYRLIHGGRIYLRTPTESATDGNVITLDPSGRLIRNHTDDLTERFVRAFRD